MKLKTLAPLLCALAALPLCTLGQESAPNEVEKLKAILAEQQRQIEALRQAVAQQQKLIEGMAKPAEKASAAAPAAPPATPAAPAVSAAAAPASTAAPSASSHSILPSPAPAGQRPLIASNSPMVVPGAEPAPKFSPPLPQAEPTSPLQLKIGDVSIIPIGFMDLTAVWRDKNAASGIGTNFAAVPYVDTPGGHLTEFRFSPQNSRLGFRADVNVHGAHVIGYNEFDFLGTSGANNIGVTNGAFVPRIRLYWVDVRKNQWEFLAGQSWSMLTPNRKGISPLPGDIFYSQVMDVNYLAGLTWTRQPGIRIGYHPTEKVAFGVALENPDQYIGGSAGTPVITLPSTLSSFAGGQYDNGSNVLNTPNLHPDIIAKLAFDPTSRVHFELAGIERTFKDVNPSTYQAFTKAGGGGSANINFEIARGVRLISNNHWGDGTGRYLFGTVPDVIVRSNGSISPVHEHAHNGGIEGTFGNTLLFFYYGGTFISRNSALDANGTTYIGYGYPGSALTNNKSLEELSLGFIQTFWKDAKWGALSLIGQYQYELRNPWVIPSGQPSSAHDNAIYMDVRYTLPGAPPAAR